MVEDFFRSSFEGFGEEPSDAVWSALDQRLDALAGEVLAESEGRDLSDAPGNLQETFSDFEGQASAEVWTDLAAKLDGLLPESPGVLSAQFQDFQGEVGSHVWSGINAGLIEQAAANAESSKQSYQSRMRYASFALLLLLISSIGLGSYIYYQANVQESAEYVDLMSSKSSEEAEELFIENLQNKINEESKLKAAPNSEVDENQLQEVNDLSYGEQEEEFVVAFNTQTSSSNLDQSSSSIFDEEMGEVSNELASPSITASPNYSAIQSANANGALNNADVFNRSTEWGIVETAASASGNIIPIQDQQESLSKLELAQTGAISFDENMNKADWENFVLHEQQEIAKQKSEARRLLAQETSAKEDRWTWADLSFQRPQMENNSKWTVSPLLAGQFASRSLQEVEGVNQTEFTEAFYDQAESMPINWMGGAYFSYDVADLFRVRTGLFLNQWRMNSSYDVLIRGRADNLYKGVHYASNNSSTISYELEDAFAETIQVDELKNIQLAVQQRINYLQIPLELEAGLAKGKWEFNVHGGFAWNHLIGHDLIAQEQSGIEEIVSSTSDHLKPGYLSYQLGFSMKYRVNRRLSIDLSPFMSRGLTSMNTDQFFVTTPSLKGLKVGLSFKL